MKFRYLPLLAVAFAFGCSKPAATGDTASKSPDTPSVTSSTAPGSTSSTSSSTGSTSTTNSTGPSVTPPTSTPPTGSTTTPTDTPTGKKPTDAKGTTPPPPPQAGPPPGAMSGPPQQPTMTPEQQAAQKKQMDAFRAQQQKQLADNSAKAEKATKSVLDGVKGTYKGVIDESTIPAEVKARPSYASDLAKAKANPPLVIVANDGSVSIKGGPTPQTVTGFTSTIDGKPAFVLSNPTPKAGMPSKLFIPISVSDGGSTLKIGNNVFKRS